MRARIYVMLPNFITLARFLLACVFCALLHGLFTGGYGLIPAMAVFLAVCASDVLDGKAARRLGAASAFGAVLDVFADAFYVVSSFTVLTVLNIIPVWFFVLVIIKFAEYVITSHIISRRLCKSAGFVRDPLGRCAAVLYFVLPGAICLLGSIPGLDCKLAIDFAICAASLLTLISSIVRWRHCINTITRREAFDERRDLLHPTVAHSDIALQKHASR